MVGGQKKIVKRTLTAPGPAHSTGEPPVSLRIPIPQGDVALPGIHFPQDVRDHHDRPSSRQVGQDHPRHVRGGGAPLRPAQPPALRQPGRGLAPAVGGGPRGLPPGAAVLDLCCGTGDQATALRRRGARVAAADFCVPMLAIARHKFARTAPPGRPPSPPTPWRSPSRPPLRGRHGLLRPAQRRRPRRRPAPARPGAAPGRGAGGPRRPRSRAGRRSRRSTSSISSGCCRGSAACSRPAARPIPTCRARWSASPSGRSSSTAWPRPVSPISHGRISPAGPSASITGGCPR